MWSSDGLFVMRCRVCMGGVGNPRMVLCVMMVGERWMLKWTFPNFLQDSSDLVDGYIIHFGDG